MALPEHAIVVVVVDKMVDLKLQQHDETKNYFQKM